MTAVLTVNNLTFAPTAKQSPSRPVSCTLSMGQLVWVQGPNGSGKTTFVRTLLGLAHRFDGTISAPHSFEIQYLPQLQNLSIPWPITLSEVLRLAGMKPPFSPVFHPSKWNLSWNTASGGERQLVLLLRVLSMAPKLLIVDEPFNGLDQEAKQNCIHLLKAYLDLGGALIIVEHLNCPEALIPYRVSTLDFAQETSHV